MPPSAISSPSIRSADEKCWSLLAGKRTPRNQIPPCALCGSPSLGGRALSTDGAIFDVEFFCSVHGDPVEATVNSSQLYPGYSFIGEISPGVYRIRKLSRDEMLDRVTSGAAR